MCLLGQLCTQYVMACSLCGPRYASALCWRRVRTTEISCEPFPAGWKHDLLLEAQLVVLGFAFDMNRADIMKLLLLMNRATLLDLCDGGDTISVLEQCVQAQFLPRKDLHPRQSLRFDIGETGRNYFLVNSR